MYHGILRSQIEACLGNNAIHTTSNVLADLGPLTPNGRSHLLSSSDLTAGDDNPGSNVCQDSSGLSTCADTRDQFSCLLLVCPDKMNGIILEQTPQQKVTGYFSQMSLGSTQS